MKLDSESLKTKGHWLGAASGASVPALTFFSSYSPPIFPGVSFITTALSGAILLIVVKWNPKADGHDQPIPRIVKQGMRFLVASLLLLIAYILLLQFTTIRMPTEPNIRLQIGFGKFDWTLTEAGKSWKRFNPSLTVTEMVRNEAAFTQERVEILWQTWSVYLAGFLLIVLYFFAFITWAGGFALLAKQRSNTRNDSRESSVRSDRTA
jgi:hypothetical protein